MRDTEIDPERDFIPGVTDLWSAIVDMDRGDIESATSSMIAGLKRFRGLPDPYDFTYVVSWILRQGARLTGVLGIEELAARLLGSSQATLDEKGYVMGGYDSREVDEISRAVRAALGDAFETEYAIGRGMDPRDAHEVLLTTLEDTVEG